MYNNVRHNYRDHRSAPHTLLMEIRSLLINFGHSDLRALLRYLSGRDDINNWWGHYERVRGIISDRIHRNFDVKSLLHQIVAIHRQKYPFGTLPYTIDSILRDPHVGVSNHYNNHYNRNHNNAAQQQQWRSATQPSQSTTSYLAEQPTNSFLNAELKMSPYNDLISTVLKPINLAAVLNNTSQLKTVCLPFVLNSNDKSVLDSVSANHELHLRLYVADSMIITNDMRPGFLQVKINGSYVNIPVEENSINSRQANKNNKKRYIEPINITEYCKRSPQYGTSRTMYYTLGISWDPGHAGQDICAVIQLVKKLTCEQLISKLVAEKTLDAQTTKDKKLEVRRKLVNPFNRKGASASKHIFITQHFNQGTDGEISATSLDISFLCPLSQQRIVVPCRGKDCPHLQCFDGLTYLQLNQSKHKWSCPTCDRLTEYNDLIVDRYIQSLVSNSDSDHVVFNEDGNFCSETSAKENKNNNSVLDASVVDLDISVIDLTSPTPVKNKPKTEPTEIRSFNFDKVPGPSFSDTILVSHFDNIDSGITLRNSGFGSIRSFNDINSIAGNSVSSSSSGVSLYNSCNSTIVSDNTLNSGFRASPVIGGIDCTVRNTTSSSSMQSTVSPLDVSIRDMNAILLPIRSNVSSNTTNAAVSSVSRTDTRITTNGTSASSTNSLVRNVATNSTIVSSSITGIAGSIASAFTMLTTGISNVARSIATGASIVSNTNNPVTTIATSGTLVPSTTSVCRSVVAIPNTVSDSISSVAGRFGTSQTVLSSSSSVAISVSTSVGIISDTIVTVARSIGTNPTRFSSTSSSVVTNPARIATSGSTMPSNVTTNTVILSANTDSADSRIGTNSTIISSSVSSVARSVPTNTTVVTGSNISQAGNIFTNISTVTCSVSSSTTNNSSSAVLSSNGSMIVRNTAHPTLSVPVSGDAEIINNTNIIPPDNTNIQRMEIDETAVLTGPEHSRENASSYEPVMGASSDLIESFDNDRDTENMVVSPNPAVSMRCTRSRGQILQSFNEMGEILENLTRKQKTKKKKANAAKKKASGSPSKNKEMTAAKNV